MPKTKRTFQIEVEAKLVVDAFDEGSARKKAEKVLTSQRFIGPDVRTSGEGWTYNAALMEPAS